MSRMYDAVKDCIGNCRVTYHVIPVGGWVLRCDDDGFPFMPVLDGILEILKRTILSMAKKDMIVGFFLICHLRL